MTEFLNGILAVAFTGVLLVGIAGFLLLCIYAILELFLAGAGGGAYAALYYPPPSPRERFWDKVGSVAGRIIGADVIVCLDDDRERYQ